MLGVWSLCEAIEHSCAAEQARWQRERLHALLDHVRSISPFWRERLLHWGGDVGDLPLLSREQVRAQVIQEGCLAVPLGHGRATTNSTSGSTGVSLTFHSTEWCGFLNEHLYTRHLLDSGVDISAPLLSAVPNVGEGRGDHWGGFLGEVFKTGPVVRLEPRRRDPREILDALLPLRGAVLALPADLLRVLVDLADDEPARASSASLGWVLTRGTQVDAKLRARAMRTFGGRIVDRYSCEEIGPIALECAMCPGRYHVAVANVLVEVVGHDGEPIPDGQQGRVLVTGLHGYATPFIRYELGDLARRESGCDCGFAGAVLSDIVGRGGEAFAYPCGRRRWMSLRSYDFDAIAPVLDYRVTRRRPLDIELEVVVGGEPLTPLQRRMLADLVRSFAVPEVAVEVIERRRIDWEDGRKRMAIRDLAAQANHSQTSLKAAAP